MSETLRIAHLQIKAADNNIAQNLKTAANCIREASGRGADLAVLPEMYSIGYSLFDADDQEARNRWASNAIDDNHQFVSELTQLAINLEIAIVMSYLEREGERVFNTALLVDCKGKRVVKHRKVHLWEPLPNDAACISGKEFEVGSLQTRTGKVSIGIMICADYYFPESARLLMLKGAEIAVVPNAAPINEHTHAMLKARAVENAIGVSLTNYPYDPNCTGFCCTGRSAAFNPWFWGDYWLLDAGPDEGIYVCDFDMDEIRNYRQSTYFGNAFRHPGFYEDLVGTEIAEPFSGRLTALGDRFETTKR